MATLAPILLVEDERDDIDLALRAFRESHFGNPIVVARDGAGALDYLYYRGAHALRAPQLPAAVLLDIHMPKVNGLEVLEIIKQDPVLRAGPVVMLTSAPTDPNLKLAYELGANAYVVKPVGPVGFLQVIQALGLFWTVVNEPPQALLEAI